MQPTHIERPACPLPHPTTSERPLLNAVQGPLLRNVNESHGGGNHEMGQLLTY